MDHSTLRILAERFTPITGMLVISHMRRSRITGSGIRPAKRNLPVELQPCRQIPFSATLSLQKRAGDNRGPWNVFFNGTQVAQIGVFANDNRLIKQSGF